MPLVLPDRRLVLALVPVSLTAGISPRGAVLVGRRSCDAGAISGCGGGPLASTVSGALQLQRPERQVVPVAAEVAHGAVAEIPPAIPFRPGDVDGVERPLRRRAEPQFPVEPGRDRLRLLRALGDVDDVLVALARLPGSASPRPATPRRGPRAPGRWRRPAPSRRPGGSCRWRGSGCPSAWRPSPWPPPRECGGPPRCCASAASRSRRACRACSASMVAKACVCSQVLTTTASNAVGVVEHLAEVGELLGAGMLRRGGVERPWRSRRTGRRCSRRRRRRGWRPRGRRRR